MDRLARFGTTECLDIHCHCLPGLDDGPADMAGAIELCKSLMEDGITTVIATPHQLGRYDGQTGAAAVLDAVKNLRHALAAERMPLEILAGAEVHVDERIPQLVESGDVLTLGHARSHVLLELAHDWPIDPAPLIKALRRSHIAIIIAHPERLQYVMQNPVKVRTWVAEGALLQITAGSVLGEFGPVAERTAWRLLTDEGSATIVATDAHGASRRRPKLTKAIDAIVERLGLDAARQACIDLPLGITKGWSHFNGEEAGSAAGSSPPEPRTVSSRLSHRRGVAARWFGAKRILPWRSKSRA